MVEAMGEGEDMEEEEVEGMEGEEAMEGAGAMEEDLCQDPRHLQGSASHLAPTPRKG